MGEIDEPEDPVDHGVAQRDEGVDAALDQAVDDLLEEDVHGRSHKNGTAQVPWVVQDSGCRRGGSRGYFFVPSAAAAGAAPGVTVSSASHLPPFTT